MAAVYHLCHTYVLNCIAGSGQVRFINDGVCVCVCIVSKFHMWNLLRGLQTVLLLIIDVDIADGYLHVLTLKIVCIFHYSHVFPDKFQRIRGRENSIDTPVANTDH